MESIIKQIQANAESNQNPIYKQIAVKIMEILRIEKRVPSEKEIAKLCYCSQSSITNFSKKIGVSGYRELSFRIIIEWEQVIKEFKGDGGFQLMNDYSLITSNIIKLIENNCNYIKKIASIILKEEKLVILSSFQGFEAAKFFRDNLENIGIDTHVYTSQDFFQYTSIEKNKLFLIILTGFDNEILEQYILNNILKAKDKIFFAISTINQAHKIVGVKEDHLMLLNGDNINRTNTTRHVILVNLFYEIYNIILNNESNKFKNEKLR